MKNKIISLIEEANLKKFQGLSINDIKDKLNCHSSSEFTSLMKALNELEDELVIARNDLDQYGLLTNMGYEVGNIRINPRGFGFVDLEDISYFIGAEDTLNAMDRDKVLIKIDPYGDNEASVVKILERGITKLVGTMKKGRSGHLRFLADRKNFRYELKLTNIDEFNLVDGDKVLVKITSYGRILKGKIEKVVGYKYDPGVDILSVLLEKDIEPNFSDEVMEEVKKVPKSISKDELKKRVDLRSLLTITIDGDDAKDLDDAISVERIDDDMFRLYVHIADVSYYVKANSAIDKEAYQRGTSVYVVDRVVPMLPHALCNGICSLNPHEDRLTITCMMEIDKRGEVISERIFPSVIHSDERMTYNNVNKILNGNKAMHKKYPNLLKMILNMSILANRIRKRREKLGAIDFDAKEGKVLVDKKGKAIDVVLRERGEAEMMIEDFMLSANETVARRMKWMDVPSIYRIHEQPETKKLRDFIHVAQGLGYKFNGSIQHVYPNQLASLLKEAKGKDNYDVLSRTMLRSMQKARYENQCLGHFGLALDEYLHFTSPIRRYPDLIVHRMLHKYVFDHHQDYANIDNDRKFCEEAALQASERERNAIDAEREVDDMKKSEYMEKHIGEVYEASISGVMKFGFFVELENTIEGLVRVESLPKDLYNYHEETKTLHALHSQKIYRLGDKVKVKCVDANHYLREIDFVLVKGKKEKHGR